jgi:hypothetical protein
MTREKTILALREIADFLAVHPELPDGLYFGHVYIPAENKADIVTIVKALGKTKKNYVGNSIQITRDFGDIELNSHSVDREQVCRKIVTKKMEPAQPEKVIPAIPEHEVEVVRWDCEPILAGIDKADAVLKLAEKCMDVGREIGRQIIQEHDNGVV